MTRKRPHSTFIEPWGYELHAAYTPEQWAHAAKTFGLEDDPGSQGRTDHFTHNPTDPAIPQTQVWLVWINAAQDQYPAARANVIAHEATHVAMMLLEHVGTRHLNDETTAYLIGWITQWLWENFPETENT